jgi:hypothetical protein
MKNGNVVAVKVQHKFVKKHSFVDIYTMDFLVRSVKFFFPQFEFMWLAEEMKKNMPLELAFTQEAKNAEKVAKIMRQVFITVHLCKTQLPSFSVFNSMQGLQQCCGSGPTSGSESVGSVDL